MGKTRFRAYQLDEDGSSFSYCHDGYFTLIEGRITVKSALNVSDEIKKFGFDVLNAIHITSWDNDHCNPVELKILIEHFKPQYMEYPGYTPISESGKESLKIIQDFIKKGGMAVGFSPSKLLSLDDAELLERIDVMLWPKVISPTNSNDNSTAKLFRKGHFSVLSLGDLESPKIADDIMKGDITSEEVDIMILPHHGADNGFTSQEFISAISPSVAICTSNYDSQYNHPRDEIRKLLYDNQIPLFTTKTGDVIIESDNANLGKYYVINLKTGSTEISSVNEFYAKTY